MTKNSTCKTNITVQLTGQDGNAFNLIGIVLHALNHNNQEELASELNKRIDDCPSYDALLQLFQEYVQVV